MPLYEYECEGCGEVFEIIQKFSDEPITVHEKCGGRVHRLLSAPALQFKGSGWYVTDYGRKGNGSSKRSEKKTDTDKGSADTSGKTESKSSESKPAGSDTKSD